MLNEVLTIILAEFFNYSNIFLVEYAAKLLEYIKINNVAIKLEKNK